MSEHPEIERYLQNARQILSDKAQKEGREYRDIKYVQMASGTAYNATLMIVDEYLKKKRVQSTPNPRASKSIATGCGNTTKPCSHT